MRLFLRLLRYAAYLAVAGILIGAAALGTAYWLISPRLPSVEVLKDVRLQVPMRVESADGKLIALFGETKRTPVRIEEVPAQLKNAFLAAEDADFYNHSGIDLGGILRAVWLTVTTGSKHVAGGSTITQQVARMFFLSPEVSYTRKLAEIFLAFRIENALSKDEILALYLNKSFFGHRSYGIAAAAEFYYGKTLDQLTLAECAMLASIPKFPSTGNPLSRPERAKERRAYVLGRMLDNKFIDRPSYDAAMAAPDNAQPHEPPVEVDAAYFAELVRLEVMDRLGNSALTDGYRVRTTLDAGFQEAANTALRNGLMVYDQRHGFRGAEGHVEIPVNAGTAQWNELLAPWRTVAGLVPALVLSSDANSATLYLADGQNVLLGSEAVQWARRYQDEDHRGPVPKIVADALKPGDVVRVARDSKGEWTLSQLPTAEAALVALRPDDGAVVSLVGGFSFARSKFNRATQSARQPGSGFKPFIYSAAFERGFTPASVVNDAPVSFPDPSRPDGVWTPKNDDDTFQGPIRLREALAKSVNLVSVRLLDAIGVRYAHEYMTRFGFTPEQIPQSLSMALGSAAVAPMAMARGYAVFANGGYLVDPYLVTEIIDRDGKTVYRAEPAVVCRTCPDHSVAPTATATASASSGAASPLSTTAAPSDGAAHTAARAIDPRNAYLVTSLMRDVIRRGTGSAALSLKRNDLAGKTGTTNDHRDAWFSGFNAALVVSCWVGFDDFSSLGRGEFGAKAALPIWIDYMRTALKDVPEQAFDMPPGVTKVRIDPATGLLAGADDPGAILEVMKNEDAQRLATQPPPTDEAAKQHEAYDVF
ncbi:MAG: penicillin-binding protein 1A [Dokdonella sp.]|uniref:penicillin-binding protein 1A n=1 Tax=Dokdonella sp. TaxID=2291710 RepID=UPI0025C73DE6|nr:penicillin-binding protein 1A [Dokdonella sp.]MBZ0223509.1 penicillin-binding protein 1A [Dokdonella sp.]MCC7255142.1 penicillin-binding protein 1A [Dokdonella sp.]